MTDATKMAGTDVPKYKARWDLLFVAPGKDYAQDGVKEHLETGELFGMYSGDTVDEMKDRTGAVLMDADKFVAESEKAMTTDPEEITENSGNTHWRCCRLTAGSTGHSKNRST